MKTVVTGIFLAASMLSTQAIAEESPATNKWYIGADIMSGNSDVEQTFNGSIDKFDESFTGIKLKGGMKFGDEYRVQAYYTNEDGWTNNTINGLGIDGIKLFNVTPKFSPFIQAGIGFNWGEFSSPFYTFSSSDVTAFNLKLGAGVIYQLTKAFELEAGIDWQNRQWQDIKLDIPAGTVDTTDTSSIFYAGVNWHF